MPATDELLDFLPLFPGDDEDAILARMRAWANEGLDPETDVEEWVDTREGSHWHVSVMPCVREMARLYDLAGTEAVAAGMPVWAWGEYLDDHAEVQDIVRLAATHADGTVVFTGAPGEVISAGTVVGVEPAEPDSVVPEFEVTSGGTLPAQAAPPANLAGNGLSGGGVLAAGADYAYRVTAIDAAGETPQSNETVEVIPGGGGPGRIVLTWDDVPTATGYRVYRADAAGGPYGRIAEVAVSDWTDEGAVAPNMAQNPPVANTTGGKLELPVRAIEAGEGGNVGPGAVVVVVTGAIDATVTNPVEIAGGTEVETDESLRERVIAAYAGQGAGNKRDYERWGRAWEGVGRATVIPLWNGPGTVKVIVTTADGDPVSAATVAGLQNDLDPVAGKGEGRAPVGAIVTVGTATARNIDIAAVVEFDPGYTLDGTGGTVALRGTITAMLRDYIERVEPGGEVVIAQVAGRIVTVSGVHDVSGVTVEGAGVNVPIDDDPAETPVLVEPVALTEAP